ncbi:PJA2 ligase, partial [Rynchops niger]|nr:PJA2 ligase [Rynchops niger]
MGQEGGKLAWPKPAEGYQSITGRRYRRRQPYVRFRQSLNSQGRDEHQHEDCEQLECEDVQQENSLRSSPSVQASSDLLDEPLLETIGTGETICQSVSSQTSQANISPLSLFCSGLEGNTISGNSMNPYENSEDLAEYASGGHNDLNGQNGIAFVNIDSYEPDSSDGEEDDAQDKFSMTSEAEGVLQRMLDIVFSELEEGLETLTDLESRLLMLSHSFSRECHEAAGPMPLMRYFSIDSGLTCPNNRAFESSAEDQAIPKSNLTGASCETQQVRNIVDVGAETPIAIANELNASGGTTDEGYSPEQAVRPKIRKQSPANQLGREELLPSDTEEKSGSWRRNEVAEIQQGHVEYALRNSEEMSSSMYFDTREYQGHQKNTEVVLRKNTAAQEQNMLDNSTAWDDFEDCNRHSSMSHDDEDRSEWSDGEWSTAVPSYFAAADKDHSSSDETWETVPGREECEPEVQSSSSDIEEENTDVCFQGGEQILLEEGEIPWLQYREEESSSDEEDDLVMDFLHPGLFLLDGNNNLEDDSSVSEDLEVEWRILDEFGDGLGLAQAIPYMDSRFLTLMALEGHLQQAMETAMVHLESLGFDVEQQAYPPAAPETIDCLPQITITDVYEGQEQCCTICCSEYVKDETITELPCHHLFHKLCVTLWLEKVRTCPVCRHVLGPMPPGADAATVSFLSDHDLASSV